MAILKTPSIGKLRSDRERALEKLGIRSREQIGTLMNGQRTRAERLLREMDTINEFADTTWQREAYGPRWNDEFIVVSATSPKNIDHGMYPLRNSRLARVQRIFCEPKDWVKPRIGRGDLDTMSLRGLLFSPGLLQEKLLTDTGLADPDVFEHFRGDPIGRLGEKRKYVDAAKLMMQNTSPIDPKQQRLLRLNEASASSIAEYPDGTPTIGDDAVGGILYVRERIGEKGPRRLQAQYFESSYAALRKTYYEDEVYAKEIDGLARCQTDVETVLWDLDEHYRKDTPAPKKETLWTAAQTVIVRYNEMLRACVDRHKVEAHDFLLGAADLKDRSGKPNVGKVMSKITASLARIANRFDEMKPKSGFNAQDRLVLHSHIRREEQTLLRTRHMARDMAQEIDGTPAVIADRLRNSVRDLEQVRLKPLAKPAEAMIRQIQTLAPDEPQTFADQLLTIHVIGKIQALITSLEWIRGRVAQSGIIDFPREAAFIREVRSKFVEEQIFPQRRVSKLDDIMETFGDQLAELQKLFDEKVADRETLDAALDAFQTDIALDAIVLGLPEAVPYEPRFILTSKK